MSDVYIKQLELKDWQDYKFIRLYALKEYPCVYGSNYKNEARSDDSFWQKTLETDNYAVFGLYDGNKIIGLTGIFPWREDPTGKTAIFAMDFIDKAYRGQGLTKLLYESRLEWVGTRRSKFDKAIIGHRAGNEASRRAMISYGFQFMDKEMIEWPDGTQDLEYKYELQLKKT